MLLRGGKEVEFTYRAYESLVKALRDHSYSFSHYHDVHYSDKTVIMRHDVDFSLDKAVQM
jgi:hypothetical protein